MKRAAARGLRWWLERELNPRADSGVFSLVIIGQFPRESIIDEIDFATPCYIHGLVL